MKTVAWLSDIHLEFLSIAEQVAFMEVTMQHDPSALVVSGDIAVANSIVAVLQRFEAFVTCPVYFVLGNHDAYGGSIQRVRHAVAEICDGSQRLTWLSNAGVIELTAATALIGHDGWADGRYGAYDRSEVELNDYRCIEELTGLSKHALFNQLNQLGDESANYLRRVLHEAVGGYRRTVVVTHVPPFVEACWHHGKPSDPLWLPHFSCKAMGDALLETMACNPDHDLLVLCGHTHSPGVCRPLANVEVHTAAAQYGHPAVQRLFTFD